MERLGDEIEDAPGERLEAPPQAIRTVAPRVLVTPVLIAVNVAIFAAVFAWTKYRGATFSDSLVLWGANYGPHTLDGQWWRIVTCLFLHASLPHLILNLWVLKDVGSLVERICGPLAFILLYLVAGMGASMASVYMHPVILSVGASGAIFGLFGAFLAVVIRSHETLPKGVLKSIWVSAGIFLAVNLLFGFLVPGIDMAAHVGGLVTGFLAGLVVNLRVANSGGAGRLARNLALAAVAGALALAAIHPLIEAPGDLVAARVSLGQAEQVVVDKHNDLIKRLSSGKVPSDEAARVLDQEILRPWSDAEQRLRSVKHLPPKQQAELEPLLKYVQLRRESWETLSKAIRTNSRTLFTEFTDKWRAANEAAKACSQDHDRRE